jgi:glycosyltransferase involved in cell wall biosynthesis
MIPVYNRTQYLAKTLESVLSQDPGPGEMQIEVVDDASTVEDPEPLVRRIGGDRISFFRNPRNLGLMPNFNNCIERARGEWVHILHSDDYVLPGFYARLKAPLEGREDVGAAFCRNAFVDRDDHAREPSELLRSTAGVLPGIIEKLSNFNCIRCPAMVVQRSVYERLGGFRLDLPFTADWELWLRIGAHYSIWYEPSILAAYREHSESATAGFVSSGEAFLDLLRCIEVSRPWLPPERAEAIVQNAREMFYLGSIGRASQDDAVLGLVDKLFNTSRRRPINRSAIANELLRAAQIHYRHGRRLQALASLGRAVRTRPIIAGRPLKRALYSLFRKFQIGTSQT